MESQSEMPGDHQKSGGAECGDRYNEESYSENATLDKLAESGYKKASESGNNVAGFATARGISGFAHGRKNCVISRRYTGNGPGVGKKARRSKWDGRFRLVIEMR